ncbi:TetR/AcrR family transcriptional regulator [Cryobacterium psychrophilum]|uniref:TetR/AcrR family transcriptional regulator n=1 Tax=Cryobacterium psychrophilum TaxID=41988 RepID=A0A4Y8KLX4_9MICO|nr:TetR/AcrR family transcriptional regulator [Cryobacterium psychrophilum]TDW31147.1 TetR family transcriptional regulator [Cryobacterium psychrophilum]TFD78557.1 TetR/AcrR family transcriptional regulator [Cryobacterium psychrophilum]
MIPHPPDNHDSIPPAASTRDRLLDAFEELLIEGGERSATLGAVAAAAAVSKGGLLYHFASKDALVEAQLARLIEGAATDTENIRTAPAGPVDYLIRSSVNMGSPLDRSFIATTRLAQGRHEQAIAVLEQIRRGWLNVIEDAVGDHDTAVAIMLVSDGLYGNSSLAGMPSAPAITAEAESLNRLITVLARLYTRD